MSSFHLGETFDIHGGGQDLVFPHHENEIAQSEGASGRPFAQRWIHNGFVQVNHEKMSKSLGNFFTIRDVLQAVTPEALRFFLLSVHYRNPLDYFDAALNETREAVDRVYTGWETLLGNLAAPAALAESRLSSAQAEVLTAIRQTQANFEEAMDDDFNTPRALGALFELVTQINTIAVKGKLKDEPGRSMLFTQAKAAFDDFSLALGFPIAAPPAYRARCAELALRRHGLTLADVEARLAARNEARAAKDWAKADEIRKELEGLGILVKDTPAGTNWYAK
jgi:cysteinyl-tRNA synthetase